MKKNLLLFFLLFVVGTMNSFAEEWTDSDGNTWRFDITDSENHYVELTGLVSGENATVPGSVKVGEVEYAVRSIGEWAFYQNSSITSVGDLPACTSIGGCAFYQCSSLTSIGDLSVCTSIGGHAFYDCSSLTSIDLSACTSIGDEAFCRCSSLTSVGDLSACTSIGGSAFYGCSSLTSVGDLSACTSIGGSAFYGCSSLTNIGDLSACTSIGDRAFYGCSSLTNIGDLSACTSIGGSAFEGCSSLTNIGDLSACTSIESRTFSGCSSLTNIDLSACTSIGGSAFEGCSSLNNISDLSACTSIGGNAFFGCSSLTSIGDLSACTSIGSTAFAGCSSLTSIGELSVCTSIGSYAFDGCSSLTSIGELSVCTSIGSNAFNGCSSLSTITINTNDVPTIDGNFTPITTAILVKSDLLSEYKSADIWRTFANRIISLDAQTVYDINVVPPTTGSGIYNIIGEENLGNVISLKLSGEINGYDFLILRNNMPNLHFLDMSNVRIVAASDNFPYYDGYYTEYDVFPPYAFSRNKNIVSIILPNSITEIGNHALEYSGLKEIEIPGSVKVIGMLGIQWCSNLKRVTMHNGLKSLRYGAFYCCPLETVELPSSLEEIGEYCFANSSLNSIVLPSSLTRIDYHAFYQTDIKSVYATALDPKSVQMNAEAFDNYRQITLYIPIDEENGWDATYYAYFWNSNWGQFGTREKWTPKYTDVTINADYEQDNGTIPSEDEVNINGQIGTNGGYIVGENASQELGNVTVELDDEKGGSIIGEGDGNLSIENLQCNIKITPNKWYFFCFPFDVNWTELDYAGVSYIWHKYDGSERAQGNGGWKKLQGNVDGDNILHAGEGYIFQANHPFTLTIQCQNPDMAAVDKAKELTTYVSSNPENASWNLIGNPFFSYFNMDEMGNTGNTEQYSAPVTVYDGNNYQALRPGDDDYQFHPFQAFFVQKPEGESQLTFGSEGRETYTQSVEVQSNARALRAMARKNPDRQIINLTISDGENTDKTRVVFNEAKSMAYEAECDASKFFTTEAVPQIYTICNGVSYSINERPNAEGSVELGMRISKEGTYTIEAARMDTPMLLTDHETGITTDLSEGAYSFIAKAGTYAKRFTMVKANDTTAIDGIEGDSDNSALYDLNGRKMSAPQHGIMIKANKKVLMK